MCTKILDKMTYHTNRLNTEYGGIENYFPVGFGLTIEQLATLQSLYFQNK
ncbi:MAG: hypothetical protein FD155_2399 [Bacteroidetes bacterium]|nr:MAG: hypothetical protein FD155_2399 [Bacteroidota bacterium]